MNGRTIGMIGTRFAGLDGVTLEAAKVAAVLKSLGHRVVWFAGQLGPRFSPGVEAPEAYFDTPVNRQLSEQVFGVGDCPDSVLDLIEEGAARMETEIIRWIDASGVDLLMPQNALAIPMQIPLGVAIARSARTVGLPVLAHHHDFAWERERFWPNAIGAYLAEAFPATGPGFSHLVINSIARSQLALRTGTTARILPNIMDFDHPPTRGDGAAFRSVAGLDATTKVILQPTRMIPRKGIEDTIDLARRLSDIPTAVVVTHPEPDEGAGYVDHLVAVAADAGVDFRIVPAEPPVTLGDAYAAADLVAYPSRIEGFGNALLEALYFRRPILVNRYPVYVADIAPRGIRAIEIDGGLTDDAVASARSWLAHPAEWRSITAHNYAIGRAHFSYSAASRILAAAIEDLR